MSGSTICGILWMIIFAKCDGYFDFVSAHCQRIKSVLDKHLYNCPDAINHIPFCIPCPRTVCAIIGRSCSLLIVRHLIRCVRPVISIVPVSDADMIYCKYLNLILLLAEHEKLTFLDTCPCAVCVIICRSCSLVIIHHEIRCVRSSIFVFLSVIRAWYKHLIPSIEG